MKQSTDYWKKEFENLYNDIVKLIKLNPDEFSDGEVIDAIHETLNNKYEKHNKTT